MDFVRQKKAALDKFQMERRAQQTVVLQSKVALAREQARLAQAERVIAQEKARASAARGNGLERLGAMFGNRPQLDEGKKPGVAALGEKNSSWMKKDINKPEWLR